MVGVVYGLAVALGMFVNVRLSGAACPWVAPGEPLNVNAKLPLLQKFVLAGVTVPPTDRGLTVTVLVVEFVEEQTPLVTNARKSVLAVRLPVFNVSLVSPVML